MPKPNQTTRRVLNLKIVNTNKPNYKYKVMDFLGSPLKCGNLTLAIATNSEQIQRCQKLRFEVFNKELGEGIAENQELGLDVDQFDQYCEHLMVLNEDKLIGTFRILHGSNFGKDGFYSQSEFQIDDVLKKIEMPSLVEVGRACIDPEHRKQITLMALFMGLWTYLRTKKTKYFFGCSSLPPECTADDAVKTAQILEEKNLFSKEYFAEPLNSHKFSGDPEKGQDRCSDLMKLYFKLGAKVISKPAYDPIFKCYDVLTLFNIEELSPFGRDLINRFDGQISKQENPSKNAETTT